MQDVNRNGKLNKAKAAALQIPLLGSILIPYIGSL
jgi:hypothetical protein